MSEDKHERSERGKKDNELQIFDHKKHKHKHHNVEIYHEPISEVSKSNFILKNDFPIQPFNLNIIKGDKGEPGKRGERGKHGKKGRMGKRGHKGDRGERGHRGERGERGKRGHKGHIGNIGPIGNTGPIGLKGDNGGLVNYGYIYNLAANVVQSNLDIPFSNNGIITNGIIHNPYNTNIVANIVANTTGIFKLSYNLLAYEPNKLGITLNGNIIIESIYTTPVGNTQNNGQILLSLSQNDIITLRNLSNYPITLYDGNTINSSIMLEMLN
jgi:hypothetical protein